MVQHGFLFCSEKRRIFFVGCLFVETDKHTVAPHVGGGVVIVRGHCRTACITSEDGKSRVLQYLLAPMYNNSFQTDEDKMMSAIDGRLYAVCIYLLTIPENHIT